MKEKISMQLQIPLALIIVTLLPIVSAQAFSDDATTTIGRQIQSEVEINLEILNSLPSNDLSLGTAKIGKPKKLGSIFLLILKKTFLLQAFYVKILFLILFEQEY